MSTQEVFTERLISLREERGIKRQQLADDLGITRASLEYYEKGKRKPDLEMIVKIANNLNVSTDYLLGLTQAATADKDKQAVCDYTGLTSEAVDIIRDEIFGNSIREVLNSLLKGRIFSKEYRTTLSFSDFCSSLIKCRESLYKSNDFFSDIVDQNIDLHDITTDDREKLFSDAQRSKDSVNAAEYQVIKSAAKISQLFSDGLYKDNEELQKQFLTFMLDTDWGVDNGNNQESE